VWQAKLYKGVIDDVINTVRDLFNEEGLDEQILMDLKTTWEKRLAETRAVPEVKDTDSAAAGASAATTTRTGRNNRTTAAATAAAAAAALQHQQALAAVPQLSPFRTNDVVQLDGPHDTSDEDEDDEDGKDGDDDHDDGDEEKNEEENDSPGEDEEPLNSEDDVSDEEPNELFETDNVVVCQYDKITRSRNKWKFHLKDGVMNLNGKDFVFQKANGDAEW
jgi:transcription initiation factor TFIIA large subunit